MECLWVQRMNSPIISFKKSMEFGIGVRRVITRLSIRNMHLSFSTPVLFAERLSAQKKNANRNLVIYIAAGVVLVRREFEQKFQEIVNLKVKNSF